MPDSPVVIPPYSLRFGAEQMDEKMIHSYLSGQSYWAAGRDLETVAGSLRNSFCGGVFCEEAQVGFGRLVTDYYTFAYLADVFILPEHSGRGLGKALLHGLFHHPAMRRVERWSLKTQNAHALYAGFGFTTAEAPGNIMERKQRFT